MARTVSTGSQAVFATAAQVTDGTDNLISYQWQLDEVDLVDGQSIPTTSNISESFYTTTIIDAYPGAGTVGSRSGFTNGDGTGGKNGFRYNAPPSYQNYFVELRATSNWNSTYNFVGVCDDTQWNDLNWTSNQGARMMWYVRYDFSFGGQTGTSITMSSNFNQNQTGVNTNDIVGIVVNQQQGAVNVYVNGNYICTMRNPRAAGRNLYVALSDWFNRIPVSCEMLTSPSSYSSSYFFPSSSSNQDSSIGGAGGTGGSTIVSGSKTSTLVISSGNVLSTQLRCKISHPKARNSPVYTDAVQLQVVSPRETLALEYPLTNTNRAILDSKNLTEGSYTIARSIQGSSHPAGALAIFYAADKDLNVLIDIYGEKGVNNGGYSGGPGGVSTIKLTLKKDEEYVLAGPLFPQNFVAGAVFLYRKGKLIAVVGGGGNAGRTGNGGPGGGVNVSGGSGSGAGAGSGGTLFSPGTLPSTGIFGSIYNGVSVSLQPGDSIASAPSGGRTLPCAKGNYWRQQGVSPCNDIVGQTQFREANGTVFNNTGFITRGFKAGYSIRQTQGAESGSGGTSGIGGSASTPTGGGGGGATGGNGGVRGGGGGGGSGYSDGSVEIISTQQGGNDGESRVVIRLAPQILDGSVTHSFDNVRDVDLSLIRSGSIISVISEGKNAPDRLFSTDVWARHYTVTMNDKYSSIVVTPTSNITAGGGPPGGTTMLVARTLKISDTSWKIWFNRQIDGFNTYVRSFSVRGVL
jgi:hypothetical protein